jgi:hypothetical protein
MKKPSSALTKNSGKRPEPGKDGIMSIGAPMQQLPGDGSQWLRTESVLEMAERHVAEAQRHVEHQKALVEALTRARHKEILDLARKVQGVLERSLELARAHLAFERELQGG